MITGHPTFRGETTSDILASVLKFDPDWDALPAATPASIVRLLRRCLTKDRKLRLQSIGEARITLTETLSGVDPGAPLSPATQTGFQAPPLGRSAWQRGLPWAIALAFAIVAGALASGMFLHPPNPLAEPVISFIPAPPGTTFRSVGI